MNGDTVRETSPPALAWLRLLSGPWEWRLKARVRVPCAASSKQQARAPGVRGLSLRRQRHAGHVTYTLSAFPGDSPAKRFPSGLLRRGQRAECSEVLPASPMASPGTVCRVATHTSGLRTELAPEQLPWDASSRKPSWTSLSCDPGKLSSGPAQDPRGTHAPVSQSAVPSLVAAPLGLRHKACTFFLLLGSCRIVGRHRGGGGGAGRISPGARGDIYPEQASQGLPSLARGSNLKLLQ